MSNFESQGTEMSIKISWNLQEVAARWFLFAPRGLGFSWLPPAFMKAHERTREFKLSSSINL